MALDLGVPALLALVTVTMSSPQSLAAEDAGGMGETRGLATPAAFGPCRAATERGVKLVEAAPQASVGIHVNFPSGSDVLSDESKKTLKPLAEALSSKELEGYCFRIEGHTDDVGSAAYNRQLSERRAKSVLQYLVKTAGLTDQRLVAVGFGEDQPLAPNDSETDRARNRRVQVANLGTRPRVSANRSAPDVSSGDGASAADLLKLLNPAP